MRRLLLFLICVAALSGVVAQNYNHTSNGEVVNHQHYSLSYIEEHEQAEWVYYTLTPAMLSSSVKRSNSFKLDPKVSTKSAVSSDYTKSGYDRGHLCPAADMSFSELSMKESFYMSNISPQLPSFNRGGWKQLEELVRKWALNSDTLHVVVGAVLKSDSEFKRIGTNEVSVPTHFYKIVYRPASHSMAAFVMPNTSIDNPIESYAASVDTIEQMTGIDFFPEMEDDLERRLEAEVSANPIR